MVSSILIIYIGQYSPPAFAASMGHATLINFTPARATPSQIFDVIIAGRLHATVARMTKKRQYANCNTFFALEPPRANKDGFFMKLLAIGAFR